MSSRDPEDSTRPRRSAEEPPTSAGPTRPRATRRRPCSCTPARRPRSWPSCTRGARGQGRGCSSKQEECGGKQVAGLDRLEGCDTRLRFRKSWTGTLHVSQPEAGDMSCRCAESRSGLPDSICEVRNAFVPENPATARLVARGPRRSSVCASVVYGWLGFPVQGLFTGVQ